MKKNKKTCFAVMGYGVKVDYASGRNLDLDKTYENIVRPVCKDLGLECFRAKDMAINGIIDKPMYEWIYKADVVIADISTLNANALYELGVRHALRPCSTIVISEKELKYPFDVNHTVINPYEHLGTDIGVSEAKRFKSELKKKLASILSKSNVDSPVYTFLPSLQPPKLSAQSKKKPQHSTKAYPSISELIKDAEDSKNRGNYVLAAKILSAALKYDENNQFIMQRLALVTYKSEKPNKMAALKRAFKILKKIKADSTTDPETLGLCGAVYKRMFEETKQSKYIETALWYYERGFYIKQDYYNGWNVSYLYDQLASLSRNKIDAIYYSKHANMIRKKVVDICDVLMREKTFSSRSDKVWIIQTMYQALIVNRFRSKAKKFIPLIKKYSKGSFDQETLKRHLNDLLRFRTITTTRHKLKI